MKLKFVTLGLILSFIIFFSPALLSARDARVGNLTGFIYAQDGTTPVEGAVVKIKNIGNETVYESEKTDINGTFRINGIPVGLYAAGVSTSNENFNLGNLVGIKEGETAKISLSLIPRDETEETSPRFVSRELPPKNEIRIGKVAEFNTDTMEVKIFIEEGSLREGDKIHFKGFVTDFYQKVERILVGTDYVKVAVAGQMPVIEAKNPVEAGDFVYLVLKKKGFFAFFLQPCGIATLLAGTIITVYGIKEPEEEEPEKSPFK